MKPTHALLIAIGVVLWGFTATGQGLYVESTGGNGEGIEKFWYMPHMFRSIGDDGMIAVIRLDKEVIYNIDPAKKTYTEFHFSEMKGMKDKVAAMMKKRMEGMSPEQKKQMEEVTKQLGGMSPEKKPAPSEKKYQVVNTGEAKSISGYSCTKYIVKRQGEETETIWATNDIRGTESLRKDMEQFMEKVTADLGVGKMGIDWYKEIRGFPIRTEDGGSARTVTKIEQRSISSSEFDVPAGYTKEKQRGLEEMEQEDEE